MSLNSMLPFLWSCPFHRTFFLASAVQDPSRNPWHLSRCLFPLFRTFFPPHDRWDRKKFQMTT
ncbi:mCG1047615 [Mus musculus]|nr:mCG1047615 [Mus musculus]